jgi:thiol-disulfide isomerase/thioredoxin
MRMDYGAGRRAGEQCGSGLAEATCWRILPVRATGLVLKSDRRRIFDGFGNILAQPESIRGWRPRLPHTSFTLQVTAVRRGAPFFALARARKVVHTHAVLTRIIMLCAVTVAVRSLDAAETKLPELRVNQKVYTNVTIFGANATDLFFSHAQGLANVKLKYLEPDIRERFAYDPGKAGEAERQQAEDERRFADALAKNLAAEAANRLRGPATLDADSLADAMSDKSPLNQPMPELAVEKWLTDKPLLQGKVAIVFFWTTTSLPCRSYVSQLNSWQKKYGDKLVVVGISPETEQQISQMTELPVEFAFAVDSKSRLANAVGVTDVPQILLVDPKGVVRYRGHPAAVTEKTLQQFFSLFAPEAAK